MSLRVSFILTVSNNRHLRCPTLRELHIIARGLLRVKNVVATGQIIL